MTVFTSGKKIAKEKNDQGKEGERERERERERATIPKSLKQKSP